MVKPILFVGDIHLGRTPHRLAAAGLDPTKLGPAEAWRRVHRYAIARDVQAVVLAGDVVDQEKDRFEAFDHLHRGVTALLDAGVAVIGVAGNHDAIALPRLAERIEAFVLLGAGGCWQRLELDGIDLVGWSFPARHHYKDPLQEHELSTVLQQRRPNSLCLGVLHTDLDGGNSPYAPTTLRGLERLPVTGWFLGHVHQPSALCGDRPIGYLGSLVGLDRGEVGPRGPWLVTPLSASQLRSEQIPLGPVLWREVAVDVGGLLLGVDVGDAADDVLHGALMTQLSQLAEGDTWFKAGDFTAVGCSIRFHGRSDATDVIRRFVANRTTRELVFRVADVPWVVVAMRSEVRPNRDLGVLAQEASPLGQVARLLLALDEHGTSAVPDEVRRAGFDPAAWLVDANQTPLPEPVDATRAAAMVLLERLLAQRADQKQAAQRDTSGAP